MRHTKRETISNHFTKQKNKSKMTAWIMRQYFDPQLHASEPWFDSRINRTNVLNHLSRYDVGFPLTPYELADLWNCVNYLQGALKNSRIDKTKKKTKNKGQYQTGETTLTQIGSDVGNVSATLINRIILNASEKLRTITNEIPIQNLDESELQSLNDRITKVRKQSAAEFSTLLLKHSSARDFIKTLNKKGVLREIDLSLISDNEVMILDAMIFLTKEEIEQELITDIEKSENLIKSFQYYASKKTYPRRKKGKFNL